VDLGFATAAVRRFLRVVGCQMQRVNLQVEQYLRRLTILSGRSDAINGFQKISQKSVQFDVWYDACQGVLDGMYDVGEIRVN
jgi:hypothetical protein